LSNIELTPIYLPDGQIILAEFEGDSTCRLHGYENEVQLSGGYASALHALTTGCATETELKRLRSLENRPWLSGLSHASTTPTITAQACLTGSELGMVFMELTDKCNEKCIHCYADSSPDCNTFLSLDKIRSVLDQLSQYGSPYLQFTGGDPLIHPNLLEAVEHASGLPFSGIEIYTNGLLLHEKQLKALLPFNPSLSFSIYADNPTTHDAITQVQGSWKRTIDAMKRAKDAGLNIRAGVVLMDSNIHCAENMPAFLKQELDIEPDRITFDAVNQVGRGRRLEMISDITPSHRPSAGKHRKGKLCIASNGDVYPCIFARSFKLGNITEQSLDEIFSQLKQREGSELESKHWNSCREQLSCGDCRIISYTIKV